MTPDEAADFIDVVLRLQDLNNTEWDTGRGFWFRVWASALNTDGYLVNKDTGVAHQTELMRRVRLIQWFGEHPDSVCEQVWRAE